ncbi:MAG: hypothetical protein EXS35_14835 [Pedosphaera sp.]|nr:hypothetical protein [Pedosphaera sp.]
MKTRRSPAGAVCLSLLALLAPGLTVKNFAQGGPPQVLVPPQSQTNVVGSTADFSVVVSSFTYPTYQWRFNGVNIANATNTSYTLFNVQTTNAGDYSVAVTNAVGYVITNATLTVLAPPVITAHPVNLNRPETANANFSVTATGAAPLSYQWRFYTTNFLAGQITSTLSLVNVQAWQAGLYSAVVSNPYGAVTSSNATLTVTLPSWTAGCWGNTAEPASTVPVGLSGGYQAVAAGGKHSLALKTNGVVFGWGDNTFGQLDPPPDLTNAIKIAAGMNHSLALRGDGTVVAWGDNSFDQTNVPSGLSNVISLAAGDHHNLALLADGKVIAWGQDNLGETVVPPGLTDVVRIAAGYYHSLALKRDGSIVTWGDNSHGELTPPPGLTGVIAVSAGNGFNLALRTNRSVVAWGDNASGQTNVPAGLNTVAAISAGGAHCVVLRENGSVAAWGQNFLGETNVPFIFTSANSALIAVSAGAHHSVTLKGNGAPVVVNPPWDQSVSPGATAMFALTAAGNNTLSYQWRLNGTNIAGATQRFFTRTNAQLADAGVYSCVIANPVGTNSSASATLTVKSGAVLTPLGYDAGGFHLRLTGPPGVYVVEISPNLTAWFSVLTNTVPPAGFLDLIDPTAVSASRRFYRAYQQ